MELMEGILTRRSITKFTDKPVSDNDLNDLLKAAMQAPSAGNKQPWHFIIINDRKILDAITEFHDYSKMLKESPVAILVCGDFETEKYCGYWVQDWIMYNMPLTTLQLIFQNCMAETSNLMTT